ncbi:hypothetical protein F5Y12DRAFT_733021 [Xylaria sp. FL1777]|nr:hypothetical protein F5Y12DRAFT_733021 [Xylaria sp. FL1777]
MLCRTYYYITHCTLHITPLVLSLLEAFFISRRLFYFVLTVFSPGVLRVQALYALTSLVSYIVYAIYYIQHSILGPDPQT